MTEEKLQEAHEKFRARVRALDVGAAEEAILRMLRFMFSDDEGNWDQAAADEFLQELENGGKADG